MILEGLVEVEVLQFLILLLKSFQVVESVSALQLRVLAQSSEFVLESFEERQDDLLVLLRNIPKHPHVLVHVLKLRLLRFVLLQHLRFA